MDANEISKDRKSGKKVLMLLPNGFDPDPRVYNEAKSLVNAGYQVTVLCWDRDAKYEEKEVVDGIQIERFFIRSSYGRGSSQLLYLLRFWKRAYRKALLFRPDVVHAHDFNTLPLGYIIGKRLKIPVIFDAHESYHEMLADNVHPLIKKFIARAERFFVKRVDLLITVGALLEKEYIKRGAKRTCVLGNWKRLEEFHFTDNELETAREELGIPENCTVISYVGYFMPSRGLIPLINAVSQDKEVFLMIGGKGKMEDEIIAAIGETENILYLGYTPPDRVPIITALSDVIYYGLQDSSGNNRYSAPNKLFEALAAGRAILTGHMGEIGQLVKEEGCGINLPEINVSSIQGAFDKLKNHVYLEQCKKIASTLGEFTYNWARAEKILFDVYRSINFQKND